MKEAATGATISDEVSHCIVDMIANSTLVRGDRVREVQLAKKLGVSRIPLREAMKRLASQGVLEPRPRGGMNVKEFSPSQIEEIIQVRAALEPIAMRCAAKKLQKPQHRITLNAIIEEMKWAVEKRDRVAVAEADIAFHRFLIEQSGNHLIAQIWAGLELQLDIIFRLELCQATQLEEVVSKHVALRDLLFDQNFEELDAHVATHVRPEINNNQKR